MIEISWPQFFRVRTDEAMGSADVEVIADFGPLLVLKWRERFYNVTHRQTTRAVCYFHNPETAIAAARSWLRLDAWDFEEDMVTLKFLTLAPRITETRYFKMGFRPPKKDEK